MPARAKAIVFDPLTKMPVPHDPSSAVAVCDTPLSVFVHVTVSETLTLTADGWYVKSRMTTAAFAASAADPIASRRATPATIAPTANARRDTAIRYG